MNEELQSALQSALEKILAEHDGALVNKWIVLADVTDRETGVRSLWSMANEEAKSWDTLGMLHAAIEIENQGTSWERTDDY